jgi:hypothetical protein
MAPATPASGSTSEARRGRGRLMAALVLATVLGSLDSSFVPLTFSDLIVKLDTSTSVVVWVALGYLIAATGPMLFLARIGTATATRCSSAPGPRSTRSAWCCAASPRTSGR